MPSNSFGAGKPRWPTALAELAANPGSTALLFDIDGTLAPIVERPELARVDPEIAAGLDRLADTYALVACISGRRALEARELVGASQLEYIGLHGIERLTPGESEPEVEAGMLKSGEAIRAISDEHAAAIDAAGIRVEDKHPITALHWRGVADERRAAKAAREVAEAAVAAGATIKPGRKVLELRPAGASDKGAAVAGLIAESGVERVLYAGDDSTDVDAFRALGQMRVDRRLRRVVRVAVASAEEPADLRSRADVVVSGPAEIADLVAMLDRADRQG